MDEDEDLLKYYKPPTRPADQATPSAPSGGDDEDLNRYYRSPNTPPQAFGFNKLPSYEGEVSPYGDPEAARTQAAWDTAKDVGASALTRFPIGVAAGSIAAPGSMEQAGRGIMPLAAEKVSKFLVGQDFITPRQQEQMMEAVNAPSTLDRIRSGFASALPYTPAGYLMEKYAPSVPKKIGELKEQGYLSPSGLPTSEGVEAAMKKVAPFLAYEPKTEAGEYAGKAADVAGQFLVGPVKGAVERLAVGTVAGLGAKGGEKIAEKQDVNPATGELLGTVSGVIAGSALTAPSRYLPFRKKPAEEDLAKSLDAYGNQAAISAQRLSEGASLKLANDEILPRVREFFGNFSPTGQKISAQDLKTLIEKEGRARTDAIYDLARNDARAANVPSQLFSSLEQKYPVFREAMEEAKNAATKNPDFNIVPPTPAKSTPIMGANNQPILDGSGNPMMRTMPGTDGNLAYWDQVHQELGRRIAKELAVPGRDNPTLISATTAKKELDAALDRQVPTYSEARGSHIEKLGGINAVDAGENFLRNLPDFKVHKIKESMAKMTPEQKQGFVVGVLQNIENQIGQGQIGNVVSQMTLKPEYRERLKAALGPEVFAQVHGKVLAENLISQASALQRASAKKAGSNLSELGTSGLVGAAVGAGSELLGAANQILMQTVGLAPDAAVKAGVGIAAGMGSRALYNAGERAVAQKMLPLIQSTNPEDFSKLSRLLEAKDGRFAYDKLLRTSVALARQKEAEEAGGEEQRAFGGRIGRATGGRVGADVEAEALIRAAERAKKSFNKTTEPLLNAPDNHIAKALEVANRAI